MGQNGKAHRDPPDIVGISHASWIFFIVESGGKPSGYHDQFGCGIGSYGMIGCDRVPDPVQIGLDPDLGPARRQRYQRVGRNRAARFSDTPTFSRDVDILPEGDRLENGDARSAKGCQARELPHRRPRSACASLSGGDER